MKNRLCLFIFFLLFLSNKIFCQEAAISSVRDSIKKYIYTNPEKTILYTHKYIKLSKANNNNKNIKLGYSVLAFSHETINNIDSTLYYYYKRLSLINKPSEIIKNKFYIARIYDYNYDYNEALRLYSQIIDLAKEENDTTIVKDIRFSIELLKTKIGLSKKGLSNEAYNYLKTVYNQQKTNNILVSLRYNRKSLIEVYLNEKNTSKAIPLINEGIEEAKRNNNILFLYYMYEFRSRSYFLLNNIANSINDANKAMDFAIQLNNENFINEINYRLAYISFHDKKYNQSLVNLKTILKSDNKKLSLQSVKYYKLIANIYKELDSIRLSNKFYSHYIEEREKVSLEYLSAIESIHDITLKEQLSDVKNSYEEELQEEIFEKEKLKQNQWLWATVSLILLFAIVALFLFTRKKSKTNQKRFDDLMLKINEYEEQKTEAKKIELEEKLIQTIVKEEIIKSSKINENQNSSKKGIDNKGLETEASYIIDDKKVAEILTKLQKLEDKMYFLRQDCTLPNMAKKLKTNTSYLSKIINKYQEKSFSVYINELRINHVIIELKNNKRLRSYTVKSIAEEMGFKSADAFSKCFRAATGIKPSVYIKKIQEI